MPEPTITSLESRLLRELAGEERALIDAAERLRLAQNDFDVAARKYAAVRSMVSEYLGCSPYHKDAHWPPEGALTLPADRRGRYRFMQMKPREAVIEALAEAETELTLSQLSDLLRSGGLDLGLRILNAALMRTAGVVKTSKGTYSLAGREADRRVA